MSLGKCLELVGVKAGDSRDSYGRNRFFPFHPADHLTTANRDPNFWYWKSIWYPMEDVKSLIIFFCIKAALSLYSFLLLLLGTGLLFRYCSNIPLY